MPISDRALRAAAWVLTNEVSGDQTFSNHPNDRGGRTSFGVTETVAKRHGLTIEQIDREAATRIFAEDYWSYDWVRCDSIATKLLDIAVNGGPDAAASVLQSALILLGNSKVEPDGILGPITQQACNRERDTVLLAALCYAQADRYAEIVAKNPLQRVFIRGWLVRALRTDA